MNVYGREMRANLRSLILWCLGMALLVLASMAKFAAMAASGEQAMVNFVEMLPEEAKAVMGMNGLDLADPRSFFVVIYLFMSLMAAIHASTLGAVIISKEERDRTSEFLFPKPATRAEILTAKLLAALTNIVALNLFLFAVSAGMLGHLAGGRPYAAGLGRLMLGLFLLQLLFAAVGAAAAAIAGRPRVSSGAAAGAMFFAFLLSSAIDINRGWEALRFLTPFKYFPAKEMMLGSGLDGFTPFYTALALALAALLTLSAYWFFRRRDLRI